MKKLILSLSLILIASYTFAQKTNVAKVESLLSQENPDFKAAREAIKLALQDESTKNDAKTWYTAGLIGEKESDNLYAKATLKQPVDTLQKGRAIIESIKYYTIADSLDKLPDEKGKVKPRYTKKIRQGIASYYKGPWNLYDIAALYYNKRDYAHALEMFNAFILIPSLPFMAEEKLPVDNTAKYYAAISSRNIEDHNTAIKYFSEVKNDTLNTNYVYQCLATEYLAKKDSVSYLNTLKEGFTKFKEGWYLDNIINHYIFQEKYSEAVNYLDNAIAQAPDSADYQATKGVIEDRLGNTDIAKTAFEKALQLNPKSFKANYGLASMIYNKAYKRNEEIQTIKDNKTYNVEYDKVKAIFKESLPYMEKAYQLDPNNDDCKRALRSLYYMFQMNKEYEGLNK